MYGYPYAPSYNPNQMSNEDIQNQLQQLYNMRNNIKQPTPPPEIPKFKEVSTEEEALNSVIGYNGDTYYFNLPDNSKIFTKRLNPATGNMDFDVFEKVSRNEKNDTNIETNSDVNIKPLLDKFMVDLDVKIENTIGNISRSIKEGFKDVQHSWDSSCDGK